MEQNEYIPGRWGDLVFVFSLQKLRVFFLSPTINFSLWVRSLILVGAAFPLELFCIFYLSPYESLLKTIKCTQSAVGQIPRTVLLSVSEKRLKLQPALNTARTKMQLIDGDKHKEHPRTCTSCWETKDRADDHHCSKWELCSSFL